MHFACGLEVARCALAIVDAGGLYMVLSDLGNGVTRISGVKTSPRPTVEDGWEPVIFPLSSRVLDAVCVALGLLTRKPIEIHSIPTGRCRSLSETDTEYVIWPAGL